MLPHLFFIKFVVKSCYMIKLTGITKSFGSLKVLKGVDLSVSEGEIVSIVGPSGAGKTTLLQIMGTVDRPDSGTIIIDGTDTGTLGDKELSAFRNRKVGFVYQFHRLLPEFTALENVMMPALIGGKKFDAAAERARELLSMLGIADRAEHRPAELSGGEKQRAAVCRALINHPAVVLADEPSGSLDSESKKELYRIFFELREKLGQTFVIVTHDDQLAGLADRTIRIVDGRIV